ncbi:MAG: AMP-binding protein [Gammaproteobacteria bacterium]|nr:AMP-binding protein [Gammaproteobacteria bacterium]
MSNPLYDALFGKYASAETIFITTTDGRDITHRSFLSTSARFANVFANAGLNKGDRVVVQVEKSVEALCIYAACVQSGLVFLPLNTAYTQREVRYFAEDSGAGLIICDTCRQEGLQPIARDISALLMTLNADGSGSLADLSLAQESEFNTVEAHGEDLAAFLYTSGTTGRSKGAMLSQNNLLSNARTLTEYWEFTSKDVLLHALPIFHTHGLFVATNIVLISGASMIMMPKFDVKAMLKKLPDATCLMGVPTFYTRLLAETDFDKDLTREMRLFISGSAPLLAETHFQFEERTGHRILERYGMTETNMNTSNPYRGERRAGTVGFPLPGVELKIVSPESGIEVQRGETGMIEVKGPNIFKGYWNMPEKTKAELREDGFFITGDLGKIDEDGYVHIIGRDKDLIISGGFNIYPKEIESILDKQGGVLESAVIGVPHADFGETPVAILVRQPDQEPDPDTILKHIARELARFKHPGKLIVVDELPRNTMGKVQKNQLREQYKDLF